MTAHAPSPAPHPRTCAFHRCPASDCPAGSHELPAWLQTCFLFTFNLCLAFEALAGATRDALLALRGALAVFAPVAALTLSWLHVGSYELTYGALTLPLRPLVFLVGSAAIAAWLTARRSRDPRD